MSDSGLNVNRQTKPNNLNSPAVRSGETDRNVAQFLQRVGVGGINTPPQPIVYQSPTTVKRSPIYAGPNVGGILDRYA